MNSFLCSQYYVYELLDDAHIVTAQSPSAAFPIAIVSFLYTDTKATLEAPLKKWYSLQQFHFIPIENGKASLINCFPISLFSEEKKLGE